jgi:hypothetical protein
VLLLAVERTQLLEKASLSYLKFRSKKMEKLVLLDRCAIFLKRLPNRY